ncbi:TonB-dependent receptor [Cesiribacter sp. SM1]|uniref:TonB-dependent receptor n=1 Tax=Cesiribacter sp. SM1 TaxID=2861196 RepID=UPI001CD1A575|nr:TonB-dependent receptor [Cesiribacter sp. SM1]
MKNTLFFLFFFFSVFNVFAQEFSIYGTVQSAKDNSTLPGATVVLEDPVDSTTVTGVVTDMDGEFILENVKPGEYVLRVQFMGFNPLLRKISLNKDQEKDLNLGTLSLREEEDRLEEVVIVAQRPLGEQKGDTTSFNASSFQTLQDASGQDLVEKMPGISIQDGNIQAQGENVVRILVDGKPFFGTDVKAALQNLPAEVIASVEIYDRKSDKALLSGFDDGEREKTINIITKPNRRKGQFGKASVGYGTDDRYLLGASVNLFNEDRRLTITGLSNNINALDYSADPNSQGETRTQNGIITTNTVGLNFTDDWGEKIELSASYLFSQRENRGITSLVRNYVLSADSGQVYTENSTNIRKNMDHRFDMRFEYNLDSNNRILIRPDISLRNDENNLFFLGRTATDNSLLNQTENTSASDNLDYDFNNRMYYSHRFRKRGRTLTLGLESGYHTNQDEASRLAENIFYREENRTEILNQRTNRDRTGLSWEADFSYTEPLGERGQLELEYEIGNRINDSDKRTYNIYTEDVEPYATYSQLDTALSNTFESEYLTQELELGYQYSTEKVRIQVEGEYQQANLNNEQEFPAPFSLQRTFNSFLPTVRFDYKFSESKNFEFDYDTWTREPSIGQLQNVIDNSNPLHLRTGNPNLDQSYHNRIRIRYRGRNPENEQTLFVYAAGSIIQNNIVNATTIAEEPIAISREVILAQGSQLTSPINLDGYWDFRSYVSWGRPVEFISSNVSVNGSVNYTHRPGMINNTVNYINSSNYRLGFSVSSNISEQVDFNFFSRASYNIVENTLRPALDNNYFNQTTRLSFDWIFWQGFIYRLDLNHQLNTGLAEGLDNSFLLMNMSLGKKIFPNERGEISLNVYDLLGQNNNIRRNITETYVEDVQSNVLQRYVMLTFTYNLRHFSRGTDMKDYEELHNE